MANNQKFIACVLLFLLWGGLVVTGKAPVQDLVAMIRDALIGLGIYHTALKNPKE